MAKTKKDLLLELKETVKTDPVMSGAKSQSWLNNKVKKILNGSNKSKPLAGRMYIFEYSPKLNAKQLPLYDRFPLVIVLEVTSNKMVGINLHYIPRKQRIKLFEKILNSKVSANNIRKNTKININMKVPPQLIKAYIPKGIKGNLIEIDANEWVTAINLPTAQFIDR